MKQISKPSDHDEHFTGSSDESNARAQVRRKNPTLVGGWTSFCAIAASIAGSTAAHQAGGS